MEAITTITEPLGQRQIMLQHEGRALLDRLRTLSERQAVEWTAGQFAEAEYRERLGVIKKTLQAVTVFMPLLRQAGLPDEQPLVRRIEELRQRVMEVEARCGAASVSQVLLNVTGQWNPGPLLEEVNSWYRPTRYEVLQPDPSLVAPLADELPLITSDHALQIALDDGRLLRIRGHFTVDDFGIAAGYPILEAKKQATKACCAALPMDVGFRSRFLRYLSVGEYYACDPEEIRQKALEAHTQYQALAALSQRALFRAWKPKPLDEQLACLKLLMCGTKEQQEKVRYCYDQVREAAPEWTRWLCAGLPSELWTQLESLERSYQEIAAVTRGVFPAVVDEKERIRTCGAPREAVERALEVHQRIVDAGEHPRAEDKAWLRRFHKIPWKSAPSALTEDHLKCTPAALLDKVLYGQQNIKDAILDLFYSEKRKEEAGGLRIIFVGEAGTGKTTLGMLIAQLFNRKLAVIGMGGKEDPQYLTGFLSSFHGTQEGEISLALARTETMGPVLLYDEVDSPSESVKTVLLHAWDGERCREWKDAHFDIPFDLSSAIQIATCNNLGKVPKAVLDRAIVLEFRPYSAEDKVQIALNHVLPRVFSAERVDPGAVDLSEGVLRQIFESLDSSGGARKVEDYCSRIIKRIARLHDADPEQYRYPHTVTFEEAKEILGSYLLDSGGATPRK